MKNYKKPYLMEEELEIEDIIAASDGGVNANSLTEDGEEGLIGNLGWTPKGGN